MMPATKRDIPGESFDGYAREYVCMPAHAFTKAPADYTHVEAATLPCAWVTAWRGLVGCGQVKPRDSVLIPSTGGVSLFALQFARAAGARVIATSSSEEKLEKLKRLGADSVINYKAMPDWGQKVKELTDGRGVDHVIEVGGPGTLAQSITACRTGLPVPRNGWESAAGDPSGRPGKFRSDNRRSDPYAISLLADEARPRAPVPQPVGSLAEKRPEEPGTFTIDSISNPPSIKTAIATFPACWL
jgi:threonine dehydrogenase-like Zn-dependent dehydrogenase